MATVSRAGSIVARVGADGAKGEGLEVEEEDQDADQKTEVAKAGGDEGFEGGWRGIGPVVPEADE